MSNVQSVAVIGGGVVGMCTALALQERGLSVCVADPHEMSRQASWGNAGRIAVESSEPPASMATLAALPQSLFCGGGPVALPPRSIGTWLPFGLRVLAASTPRRTARGREALGSLLSMAVPAWRKRLQAIGASHLLVESGHYSVWESGERSAKGRAAWQRNSGSCTVAELDAAEWKTLQNALRVRVADALKFSGSASIVDLTELYTATRAAVTKRGGRFVGPFASIAAASCVADSIVVAAGVGSAKLLVPLGYTVPLIAERGYHLEQQDASWPAALPPIMFEDRSIAVTRFRNALRMTSFVELTTVDAPPDARKWKRLRRHAAELGLPMDRKATEWMGSRPTLPDYQPAIGQSRRQGGLYYAFGHQHLGLTLGALTGELVAELVAEGRSRVDLGAFDLDRFAP